MIREMTLTPFDGSGTIYFSNQSRIHPGHKPGVVKLAVVINNAGDAEDLATLSRELIDCYAKWPGPHGPVFGRFQRCADRVVLRLRGETFTFDLERFADRQALAAAIVMIDTLADSIQDVEKELLQSIGYRFDQTGLCETPDGMMAWRSILRTYCAGLREAQTTKIPVISDNWAGDESFMSGSKSIGESLTVSQTPSPENTISAEEAAA